MRTFHRTVLVVEVLGNDPFTGDLSDLSYAATEGNFSGNVIATSTEEVDGKHMAALLEMQGSAPDFLGAPNED